MEATGSYGRAVSNSGTMTISGGVVSATNGSAISNNDGTLTISGGMVSVTTGNAVSNYGGPGKVTISGTAEITSANTDAANGTICNYGTIEILGGIVSNTSSTGNAVYNHKNATGTILLGNAPQINGHIGGAISLITEGANSFALSNKMYTLNSASYEYGQVAVVGGVPFADKFTINGTGFELYKHEGDLRMVTADAEVCIVTFNLDGGSGTPPKFILTPANSRLPVSSKPVTHGFTKANGVNDGKWYTRSGGAYTEFVFNSNETGTVVDANVTLYLKWVEPNIYSITSSGTGFVPYLGSTPLSFGGTAIPIQDAINSIKSHAAGVGCHIRFGNGTDILNIGAESITFDGGTNGTDWGNITLLGNITSSVTGTNYYDDYTGAIRLVSGVSIESKANIANTAEKGRAIYNYFDNRFGTVIISDGTVSATAGSAIYSSYGTVIINGGVVSVTTGTAIYENYDGTIIINGGTVSATTGRAIDHNSTSRGSGAVIINGGTVSADYIAIENRFGIVTIFGGTVVSDTSTTGCAIRNQSNAPGVLVLGNTPKIIGRISGFEHGFGKISVITSGENIFAPGKNVYTLDFSTYSKDMVAVSGGADFLANFKLNGSGYALKAEGGNLVLVDKVSVLTHDNRIVPPNDLSTDVVAVAPVKALSAEFTAGPNPVLSSAGNVGFFRQGKRVENAELSIYDASGNFIRKVAIADNAVGARRAVSAGGQSRRQVGSWDLKDFKGRVVGEGTYVVKGVLKTVDGKADRVSVVLGVR